MNNKIWIYSLIIILISVFAWFSLGNQFSLISDNYIIYDDFNSGEDYTKWDFHVDMLQGCGYPSSSWLNEEIPVDKRVYAGVSDGLLITGSTNPGNYCPFTSYGGIVTSKKLWTTEDIKIKMGNVGAFEYPNQVAFGTVYFGDTVIPFPPAIQGPQIFKTRAYEFTRTGTLEIKRYDDLDLSKFVMIYNGEEIGTGVNTEPVTLRFADNARADSVSYLPYFSCEIDYTTDVVVRDKFASGSEINVDDLSYTPTKFCPQDLGVLIFSDQGLTDEKGSLTERIAKGETLTVPDEQYWYFEYVTKYVDDMKERCNKPGEVYSTETDSCVNTVQQEISNEGLLYCKETTDCIIPPACTDAVAECVENQCSYESQTCSQEKILNYILTLKSAKIESPQIITFTDSKMSILFDNGKNILGQNFVSIKPTVTNGNDVGSCYVDDGKYLKNENCYTTTVYWNGYEFDIKGGERKKINDWITVEYHMNSRGAYNGEIETDSGIVDYDYAFRKEEDWNNRFIVELDNFINIDDIEYNEAYGLNDDAQISLSLGNKIFDIPTAGYRLTARKQLRDVYSFDEQNIELKNGVNNYDIKLPTDELGVYTVEIVPYVNVVDDQQSTLQKVIFGYQVLKEDYNCDILGCSVGECQSNGECVVTSDDIIDTGVENTCNWWCQFINWLTGLFS